MQTSTEEEKSWQIKNTWVLIPSPSYFLLIWRTKYIMNSNPRSVILSARGNGLALLISYPAMTYFSFFPAKTSLISTPFPTLASQIGRQIQLRSMVIYSIMVQGSAKPSPNLAELEDLYFYGIRLLCLQPIRLLTT